MQEIKLDVQIRERLGSHQSKKLRRENTIPAVVYGGSRGPTTIKVDRRVYEGIMRHHQGENVVFHLNVLEGEKKLRDYSAIVKEEYLNPVADDILHIDFFRISLKEKIEVKVAIASKGEPIGVKRDGGSLDHNLWELAVVCLPTNIPTSIEVDVSALEIGQAIHVKDLTLPEGVTTNHDVEDIVLSVAAPKKIEEEVEEGEAEPEVIKEKAKEEGEQKQEEAQPEQEAKEKQEG